MDIVKGSRILFTGDSITDCGRDRNDFQGLTSYSKMINDYINIFNSDLNVSVYNRGISGNTTKMLLDRMESDLNDIKPDIVSVLIGINDVWRKYDSNRETLLEEFTQNFNNIISATKKFTSKIIVLEPFIIPSDKAKKKFREDLDPKIVNLREIALTQGLEYISLDGIFAEKSILSKPETFSQDGIHLLTEGYKVVAAEWIKRTNLFKQTF